MHELFQHFSPIEDYTGNLALEFLDYRLGEPKRNEAECREADVTTRRPSTPRCAWSTRKAARLRSPRSTSASYRS